MTSLFTSLIAHRFRGFAEDENTIPGLLNTLDMGVAYVEFDIRVAACGSPMIYHDEYALDNDGQKRFLCEHLACDYKKLGGRFATMPYAHQLFKAVAEHINQHTHLLIDIKDGGFEEIIHALVCFYRLQDRVTYVSWVPSVLYRLNEIAPDIPLCLSHWCKNPDAATRAKHKVFSAKNGHIPKPRNTLIHGERSGWFVDGPLSGKMREIVHSVCVPQNMVTKRLVKNYQKDGIAVSTFSYLDWDHILDHKSRFNIDLFFIDNRDVFETGKSL